MTNIFFVFLPINRNGQAVGKFNLSLASLPTTDNARHNNVAVAVADQISSNTDSSDRQASSPQQTITTQSSQQQEEGNGHSKDGFAVATSADAATVNATVPTNENEPAV